MTFTADDLPAGLKLDADSGLVTGSLAERGEHKITLRARNAVGHAERKFRIVVGECNCSHPADGLEQLELLGRGRQPGKSRQFRARHGGKGAPRPRLDLHQYRRRLAGPSAEVRSMPSSPTRNFPTCRTWPMRLHRLGLKFGIYSTPWRGTYEGHIGGSSDNVDGTYDWIKAGRLQPGLPHRRRSLHLGRQAPSSLPAWQAYLRGEGRAAVGTMDRRLFEVRLASPMTFPLPRRWPKPCAPPAATSSSASPMPRPLPMRLAWRVARMPGAPPATSPTPGPA